MLKIALKEAEGFQPLPGVPDWLSRTLFARGIRTEEDAERFLNPNLRQLLPPEKLHQMNAAAKIILEARDQGRRALIWGDYDVDGVCASAILKESFDQIGLACDVKLPDRHREGYGLNADGIRACEGKYGLIVTVDCGITAAEEVALAKELGIGVIVTDHHRHGDTLPPADAVVTPLLGEYPFPYLCGAGVAWKLALRLLGNAALKLTELAAIATVADMVPLTGENRAIVKEGLNSLAATARPGLRAVMNRAGIYGNVGSEQIAYQLAPRMNACGRMESAEIALEMLLTRDLARAEELAVRMEKLNMERRTQENLVLQEALDQVAQMDLTGNSAIVVVGDGWNSGVVGLAAGKIAERYCYPTVALARDGEICVGSARSAGEIDIHAALSRCADLFDRFGGHRQAAGLTMAAEKVPEFISRLNGAVREQTGGAAPVPEMICDGEMALRDVTEETVRWLEKMEPFGIGNPAPRYLCRHAQVLALRRVGAEEAHLKCTFQQDASVRGGIFFGGGRDADALGNVCRIVMTPVINEFRGKITAECRLYALQTEAESLEKDRSLECESYLSEPPGAGNAKPVSEKEVDLRMKGNQGTLLVCRCLETAREMLRRYPQADFALRRAEDPRAFHTVMLYGSAGCVSGFYRHIILCDGDLGESAAYRNACPDAEIAALPATEAAKEMLAALDLPDDTIRRGYLVLKKVSADQSCRDAEAYAALCGVNRGQGLYLLRVLEEMGLLRRLDKAPVRAEFNERKSSLPESALYRRVRLAKEES